MLRIQRIIIIDDDPLNNFIITQNIRHSDPSLEIVPFTLAQEALAYIAKLGAQAEHNVLLLDLNLLNYSGWTLLEELEQFPWINKNFHIYIISSSLAPQDFEMAEANKLVKRYIAKPFTHKEWSNIKLDIAASKQL
ncbi:MAG TPA: response regulator [Flavobacteriales bacterium]|nr:response regulator [Flavobacteriales bacterium]